MNRDRERPFRAVRLNAIDAAVRLKLHVRGDQIRASTSGFHVGLFHGGSEVRVRLQPRRDPRLRGHRAFMSDNQRMRSDLAKGNVLRGVGEALYSVSLIGKPVCRKCRSRSKEHYVDEGHRGKGNQECAEAVAEEAHVRRGTDHTQQTPLKRESVHDHEKHEACGGTGHLRDMSLGRYMSRQTS